MKKIKWVLDKDLFPEYEDKLVNAIKNNDSNVYVCDYDNNFQSLNMFLSRNIDDDNIVIFHGSIEFGRKFDKMSYYPAIYLTYDNYECYNYYGYFGDHLLNSDYLMMGLNDVIRNKDKIFKYFNKYDKVFIRPSNGFKTFTGQCLSKINFDDEFNTLIKSYGGIDMNTLVLFANSQDIKKEYRFIIIDGEIISGATYIDENNKGTNKPYCNKPCTDKNVIDYVKSVKDIYHPDKAFNIDVCELEDGTFKIIEINSFTCGSMYGNDYDKVVKAMNKLATDDYNDVFI